MNDKDSDVRLLAVKQWGPLRNKAAVSMLQKAMRDTSDYVRIAAAESLYQLEDSSGLAVLKEIVRAAPPPPQEGTELGVILQLRTISRNKVRVAALNALSRRGAASESFLRETLADRDGAVRDAASVALARRGNEDALEGFIKALGHDDSGIRERAVRALGEAPNRGTVDYLKSSAADPIPRVRAAVMTALGATRDMRAIPLLKKGLDDENSLVKANAVEALGNIPSSDAIPLLRGALSSADNVVIQLYAIAGLARFGESTSLMPAVLALAQKKDQDARLLAVEVLEAAGGEQAVEQLQSTLGDKDMTVRVRAAAAVVKLLQSRNIRRSDQ
ncbi:MAG: HEAT repeat domain-containing protein [Elusimicrobiota bacterium]